MSAEEETYCRLCADPTPKTQLISPEEDVAISSKITTKLLWINIDITNSSLLPKTICFACFDSLERTWSFLQNARSAQEKLTVIFSSKLSRNDSEDVKIFENNDAGKPVNINWETFQEPKAEVKVENSNENELIPIDSLMKVDLEIKAEYRSDNDCHDDDNVDYALGFSTDSDLPLGLVVRAKKVKRKHKKLHSTEVIDVSSITTTWDNLPCSCGRCDAQCKSIAALQLHSIQIHNQCCIFKCRDCNKKFLSFKPFVTHSRTHINNLSYCCEYCNAVFSKTSYLKRHRNQEHINIYITKCQACGMIFESHAELKEHQITYGLEFKQKKKETKIEMVLKCEFCKKEFKSKGNLQQHKLVHTERSREFACHICGKMFFTKGTLGTHMAVHEEVKPYKCEHCPLGFRTRGNLQSHLTLHTGSKPFVCEQCGKSFRVKRHLKSHSIVHTDLMPFNCEFCSKKFKFKTRLNVHLRQHTGFKPYKCTYCFRDFTNGSNYKKHMKRRHGIDTSKMKYDKMLLSSIEADGQS